ncbi:MAG: hypothetical protein M1836_004174 [Candelina mexicana]|nr:MAG: hypothetical protein M1836_004174 [Candelina mexicana]
MPPKKLKTQKSKASTTNGASSAQTLKIESTKNNSALKADEDATTPPSEKSPPSIPSKRKADNDATTTSNASKKSKAQPREPSRRSVRSAPKPIASQAQILKFLLTNEAVSLLRPADENADIEKRGKELVTYSGNVNSLTPFQELVCAVVLSRPISHALGLRTIRTIFNEPYKWRTPQDIKEAGEQGRTQALWDARTQHKGKTAEELGLLADVLTEKFDGDLEKVREEAGRDVQQMRKILKESVKGLGPTGLDIFCRRVQGKWEKVFPFVDGRTGKALRGLGLPDGGEGLRALIDESWGELGGEIGEDDDEEERKRKGFVRILEGAVGAELEGKGEVVIERAGKMEV